MKKAITILGAILIAFAWTLSVPAEPDEQQAREQAAIKAAGLENLLTAGQLERVVITTCPKSCFVYNPVAASFKDFQKKYPDCRIAFMSDIQRSLYRKTILYAVRSDRCQIKRD